MPPCLSSIPRAAARHPIETDGKAKRSRRFQKAAQLRRTAFYAQKNRPGIIIPSLFFLQ